MKGYSLRIGPKLKKQTGKSISSGMASYTKLSQKGRKKSEPSVLGNFFATVFNSNQSDVNNNSNTITYKEAPDGWDGPHKGKFLFKLVRDSNGEKIKEIQNFDKAIEIANKYDECTGITKTMKGYSLRCSQNLKRQTGNSISIGMASWTKTKSYSKKRSKKVNSNTSDGNTSKKVNSNTLNGTVSKKVNSNTLNGNTSKKVNSNTLNGNTSKKVKSKIMVVNNWINDAFKDTKFKIIETLSNGDCFFDSIQLGLPSNHKNTVKQLRQLLIPYLTQDIFERDLELYTSAKDAIVKSNIEKDKVMKSNSSKKIEKLNKLKSDLVGTNETINEWDFFDKFNIDSLEKYKEFLLNKRYWANTWSVSIIEKELNIKIIILSESSYLRNDEYNILQCGDLEVNPYSIPSCIECGMTQREREFLDTDGSSEIKMEIYKKAIINHGISIKGNETLDILKTKYEYLPVSHTFVDKEEIIEKYEPNGYIIVTYSGNHYRLVSYNKIRFFKTLDELPQQLVVQIKRKCNNVGLYKRIKDIGL